MPRPALPKAEDVAGLAKVLRAEGFENVRIESYPDGQVNIVLGATEGKAVLTPLQKWKRESAVA